MCMNGGEGDSAPPVSMPAVFMSFASQDLAAAEALEHEIRAAGVTTFFAPRDISGGMNFAVEIVRAIAACDVLVVLLSGNAISSPHVRREVSLAVDERREILPLALPGISYPIGFSTEWTYWLSAVQVMDFGARAAILQRIEDLVESTDRRKHKKRMPGSDKEPMGAVSGSKAKQAAPLRAPSSLLRADRAVVPMSGREADLSRLEQWCCRDVDIDVRILTGSAGQGKTRLALELMKHMEATGWDCCLVAKHDSVTELLAGILPTPRLIVVDYAETRTRQLVPLFETLAHWDSCSEPIRVLLLARTASDWWRSLITHSDEFAELLGGASIQGTSPMMSDREVVDEVFVTACECFALELNLPAPRVLTAPFKRFGSVLELLEGALACVLGDTHQASAGRSRLLAHERRYISATAGAEGIVDVDSTDLDRIAAGLSLLGAETEDAAAALIDRCNSDLPPTVRRRLARLFHRLYPGAGEYIEGIRPDVLAEDLVLERLVEDGHLPGAVNDIGTLSDPQCRHLMTLLGRGAARHPELLESLAELLDAGDERLLLVALDVATQLEFPGPVTQAVTRVVDNRRDLDVSVLIAAIPEETVALAEVAAVLSQRVMSSLPEVESMTLVGAQAAMSCSNRFSDAGWSGPAADAASLAVERLSKSTEEPGRGRLLGRALTNLSNRLWEVGRLDECVVPARHSVEVLRVNDAPATELAAALNNLAFRLTENGQIDRAAGLANEALTLCQSGQSDSLDERDKTLGSVLNNLSCILAGAQQYGLATVYGARCVDLRRSQAHRDRDRYLPYLARSLANYAVAVELSGNWQLADRLILEARSLNALNVTEVPIFRFEQAEVAAIQAQMLLSRGRWDSAASSAAEALEAVTGLDGELGQLAQRLREDLDEVVSLVAAESSVDLGSLQVRPPALLEYRDL